MFSRWDSLRPLFQSGLIALFSCLGKRISNLTLTVLAIDLCITISALNHFSTHGWIGSVFITKELPARGRLKKCIWPLQPRRVWIPFRKWQQRTLGLGLKLKIRNKHFVKIQTELLREVHKLFAANQNNRFVLEFTARKQIECALEIRTSLLNYPSSFISRTEDSLSN